MAIKDKDGNVYRLRGPNPVMRTQEQWDTSKVHLINIGGKEETVSDDNNPIKEFEENVLDIGKELNLQATKSVSAQKFLEEINELEPVTPEIVVEIKKEEPVSLKVDENIAKIFKQRGVVFFCAPAVGKKKYQDDLYATSYETTVYGDKLMFDAVLIEESDLQMQMWAIREIQPDSIVYQKGIGQRWWRITKCQNKSGGFLLSGVPSDVNPDFS